jgi:HEAT repeat protein
MKTSDEVLSSWEVLRLYRGDCEMLKVKGLNLFWDSEGREKTPHPAAHGRHPLPWERVGMTADAPSRAASTTLSLGERVAEGRGRVRGLLLVPPPLPGRNRKAHIFAARYLLAALLMATVTLFVRESVASAAIEVVAEAATEPAAEVPLDRDLDLYEQGTQALNSSQWKEALAAFDQVVPLHGPHVDAALYWKAYALNRLGRRGDALAVIATLRASYAQSHWIKDAMALEVEIRQAMGEAVSPENVSDEEIKLIALNGLMNSDPERAVPMLQKILQGDQPERVKDHALFVLARSGSPKARAVILAIARGQGDRKLQRKALDDVAMFGGKEGREELAQIYATSDDIEVKKSILRGFMVSGERDRVLTAAKSEKNPELRREAVRQLGVMGAGDELWQLYQNEPSQDIKREIIRSLFVGGQVDRLLGVAQNEKDDELRREAIRSLGLLGPRTADPLTALYQNEKSIDIRKEIMNAFFLQGNTKALINLARTEKDPVLRKTAVQKLSLMNSKESADFMMEILNK